MHSEAESAEPNFSTATTTDAQHENLSETMDPTATSGTAGMSRGKKVKRLWKNNYVTQLLWELEETLAQSIPSDLSGDFLPRLFPQ